MSRLLNIWIISSSSVPLIEKRIFHSSSSVFNQLSSAACFLISNVHYLTSSMATMTFDPPPTSEQVSNNSARRFPFFRSSRRSPSHEPPAYSTEDAQSSKYQKMFKLLSSIRVATSLITLALSIAVTACADNSLRAYASTNLGKEWFLPLWPAKVDLRPTHAVLACGIVILVLSVAYLAAALFPSVGPCPVFDFALFECQFYFSLDPKSTFSTSPPPSSPSSAFSSLSSPPSLPAPSTPTSPTAADQGH